jgi:hypothetical protein
LRESAEGEDGEPQVRARPGVGGHVFVMCAQGALPVDLRPGAHEVVLQATRRRKT